MEPALRLFDKRESFRGNQDFNSPRHRNSKSLTTHAKLATFELGEANPAYIITNTRRRYTLLEYQVSLEEFSSESEESNEDKEEKKNNEIPKQKSDNSKTSHFQLGSSNNYSGKSKNSASELKKRTFLKKRTVKMHATTNQGPLALVEQVKKLEAKCEDPETIQIIQNTLKNHFLFSNMDEKQLYLLSFFFFFFFFTYQAS